MVAEAAEASNDQTLAVVRVVAGRVMARRDMGKLMFLDLVDRSGRFQLIVHKEDVGPIDIDLGDIIGVYGAPGKSRRGEPSITVRQFELLSKIRAPLPDTFHGMTDREQRYRRRYLDLLMNEESRNEAIVRARMVSAMRAYLDAEGFIEVETPILSRATAADSQSRS